MQTGKRLWALTCCMLMIFLPTAQAAQPLESGTPMTLTTPSAILAETATGTVIFEKNADERREVASITKLMTALLVLEALDRDEIALTDSVQISPRAAAMKGSQALLDASAVYPLEDLLRTTIMASANDSAVALSEYIAGSEENFVDRMNRRAAELGMTNTNYVNCTGYPQSGQYTTARDVCRLCCEIAKHPRYNQYASVWIDKLTHPGGRVTDLTNTNRLVRFYEGCDGYKTGSTDAAKYCLAATAEKNGMRLVAIVLGTPVSQTRFNEARQMLDYGFATYRRVVIANKGDLLGQKCRGSRRQRGERSAGAGERAFDAAEKRAAERLVAVRAAAGERRCPDCAGGCHRLGRCAAGRAGDCEIELRRRGGCAASGVHRGAAADSSQLAVRGKEQ